MGIDLAGDFLGLGPLIQQRVRDTVKSARRVEEIANLYDALDAEDGLGELAGRQLPAVFFGFDGDQPGAATGDGRSHVAVQRWMVILVVGNARRADVGHGVLREAGPLLAELLAALSGWEPEGHLALTRITAPRPGYRAGVGFFPVMFSTAVVVDALAED